MIRVDNPNPLYGDGPYTIQPGGCGERGDFMHVTPDFVTFLESTSTQYFGTPGMCSTRYGVNLDKGFEGFLLGTFQD